MRIGIAAYHGGVELKVQLTAELKDVGYEVDTGYDYPDLCVSPGQGWWRGVRSPGAWASAAEG